MIKQPHEFQAAEDAGMDTKDFDPVNEFGALLCVVVRRTAVDFFVCEMPQVSNTTVRASRNRPACSQDL